MQKSPITARDIALTSNMLGQSTYDAKLKTIREKGDVLDVNLMKIDVTESILNHCMHVILLVDAMHTSILSFLTSLSDSTHYGTGVAVDNNDFTRFFEQCNEIPCCRDISRYLVYCRHTV